ncbi:MAG: CDP-diacylglycerol--glycerol-3-phosphate 3-phosphatidyltransferase [Candidatus Schekmanbacteria bacterium RBG_16_38_10]|uniref:CDP-diacylglycerol--glycerol-3-phosphate 3-phosphatidyltransferase n=1 Tax=Candidatus Schekmanbacteria bacterium RBG_16_38_10 TaxID=1817879 RepID=A0A1F7RZQ4_9BACT|nr:MAG: CDP-diacylglycerol--glycerol-3-phosphate 3-phosphatidyltransferase [Candidatus Schekmanbacteria bacterium RBG_16_38_10]
MNLPNKITLCRFIIAIVYFVILSFAKIYEGKEEFIILMDVAFILFLIAAISDVLDGYIARKYNIVTNFGRIADPFVDKVIVCGSFILFLNFYGLDDIYYSWMVVVVIAREFLIHNIRSAAEAKGIPFGANFWGKQKMLLQSLTILATLFTLPHLLNIEYAVIGLKILVWVMLFSTVMSGIAYIFVIVKLFKEFKS